MDFRKQLREALMEAFGRALDEVLGREDTTATFGPAWNPHLVAEFNRWRFTPKVQVGSPEGLGLSLSTDSDPLAGLGTTLPNWGKQRQSKPKRASKKKRGRKARR